jgi:hypothetical protein
LFTEARSANVDVSFSSAKQGLMQRA